MPKYSTNAPGCLHSNCTLCMACRNICPADAIVLKSDEYGYEQLVIDLDKCINCGACERICARRKNILRHKPINCYAVQHKNKTNLKRSASGGAIQALAQMILDQNGVCYGCTMEYKEGLFSARHKRVAEQSDLQSILNSKYIPSIIGDSFRKAKIDLESGKEVLFTGTPCQIQGLKAYLGDKEYPTLLTADVICHGIPSTDLFNQYIQTIEQMENIEIFDHIFKDKEVSWGTNYAFRFRKNNKEYIRHCPKELSSFMAMYLKGLILRGVCYRCSLSSGNRVSDITCGDYWGIELEHPEFITGKNGRINLRGGVGCMLVNTAKGQEYAEKLRQFLTMHEVTFESIAKYNGNLNTCSVETPERKKLLERIRNNGYRVIEEEYRLKIAKRKNIYLIKNFLKPLTPDFVRLLAFRKIFKG